MKHGLVRLHEGQVRSPAPPGGGEMQPGKDSGASGGQEGNVTPGNMPTHRQECFLFLLQCCFGYSGSFCGSMWILEFIVLFV